MVHHPRRPRTGLLVVIYAATPLAQIEASLEGEIIGREVIPQGQRLNPPLFQVVYTDLLNKKKSKKSVGLALDTADDYLRKKARRLFKPVLDYLEAEGDACSATAINHYFDRNFGVDQAITACEYLADLGMIEKVSTPMKLENTGMPIIMGTPGPPAAPDNNAFSDPMSVPSRASSPSLRRAMPSARAFAGGGP